jgi:hypothetical protein
MNVALAARFTTLPVVRRDILEPQGQATTPRQPRLVLRPVLQLDRYLRDVVTAIGVELERHRGGWDRGGREVILPSLREPRSAPTPFAEARPNKLFSPPLQIAAADIFDRCLKRDFVKCRPREVWES